MRGKFEAEARRCLLPIRKPCRPASRAGQCTGFENGFGNFAGVIGPALTRLVVDKTGSFLAPFAITVAVLILGAIAWVYLGPLEQVNWTARDRPVAPALDIA